MKINLFDVEEFLDGLKSSFDRKVVERFSGDIAQVVSMIFDHSMMEAIDIYSKKLKKEKEEKKDDI